MVAAVEGVDIVVAVDADRGAIAEHDLVGDFRPVLVDLERVGAAAEPNRHRILPSPLPHHRQGRVGGSMYIAGYGSSFRL